MDHGKLLEIDLLLIRSIIKIIFMVAEGVLVSRRTLTSQCRFLVPRKDMVNKSKTHDTHGSFASPVVLIYWECIEPLNNVSSIETEAFRRANPQLCAVMGV